MDTEHILVTGGTGLIGKAIVEALAEKHPEYKVTVLDLQPPSGRSFQEADVQYIQADITRLDDVVRALKDAKPSVVVHTAGVVPQGNDRYTRKNRDMVFNVNVNGTRNMLKIAKESGVKAFVYTSSCTVVTDDNDRDYPNMRETLPTGNASLIYGQSKVRKVLCTTKFVQVLTVPADCRRETGIRGQHSGASSGHADLLTPSLSHHRPGRQPHSPHNSRMHCQRRDAVRHW